MALNSKILQPILPLKRITDLLSRFCTYPAWLDVVFHWNCTHLAIIVDYRTGSMLPIHYLKQYFCGQMLTSLQNITKFKSPWLKNGWIGNLIFIKTFAFEEGGRERVKCQGLPADEVYLYL